MFKNKPELIPSELSANLISRVNALTDDEFKAIENVWLAVEFPRLATGKENDLAVEKTNPGALLAAIIVKTEGLYLEQLQYLADVRYHYEPRFKAIALLERHHIAEQTTGSKMNINFDPQEDYSELYAVQSLDKSGDAYELVSRTYQHPVGMSKTRLIEQISHAAVMAHRIEVQV